jgi:hypothetical protein
MSRGGVGGVSKTVEACWPAGLTHISVKHTETPGKAVLALGVDIPCYLPSTITLKAGTALLRADAVLNIYMRRSCVAPAFTLPS